MADDTESVDLMVSVQQLSLNNNLSSRIQGHSQILTLFLRQDDYFLKHFIQFVVQFCTFYKSFGFSTSKSNLSLCCNG
eukprot:m.430929 g.430929  ORF g.430929 m.430929 type:complete len:78 (+) comp17230_c0_seq1:94-327(+)